jgi:hypothetical protein
MAMLLSGENIIVVEFVGEISPVHVPYNL